MKRAYAPSHLKALLQLKLHCIISIKTSFDFLEFLPTCKTMQSFISEYILMNNFKINSFCILRTNIR